MSIVWSGDFDPYEFDPYEEMSAEEFCSFAPRPGTPSPASKLLGVTEDLFILDTRDWDIATLQPSRINWTEEEGSVTLRMAIIALLLGRGIALIAVALVRLSLHQG